MQTFYAQDYHLFFHKLKEHLIKIEFNEKNMFKFEEAFMTSNLQ
jgi:hypothetical protein